MGLYWWKVRRVLHFTPWIFAFYTLNPYPHSLPQPFTLYLTRIPLRCTLTLYSTFILTLTHPSPLLYSTITRYPYHLLYPYPYTPPFTPTLYPYPLLCTIILHPMGLNPYYACNPNNLYEMTQNDHLSFSKPVRDDSKFEQLFYECTFLCIRRFEERSKSEVFCLLCLSSFQVV